MRPTVETASVHTGLFGRLWKSFVTTQTAEATQRVSRHRRASR